MKEAIKDLFYDVCFAIVNVLTCGAIVSWSMYHDWEVYEQEFTARGYNVSNRKWTIIVWNILTIGIFTSIGIVYYGVKRFITAYIAYKLFKEMYKEVGI